MCTAITYNTKNSYFGRNLDLEYSYDERITVTPRNYRFDLRHHESINEHFAIIGMAFVVDDYPLYYDAMNEHGLAAAGLNFPGNAKYNPLNDKCRYNITSFEFIPWILSQCKCVNEAKALLSDLNITDDRFSDQLPTSPLHWMIADPEKSIVVEQTASGLHVYDNPTGVMTNNPTFDMQLFNLNNYMHISTEPAKNTFAKDLDLDSYSRGMGGIGLPGDLSSASRFVKVAFTKLNSRSESDEWSSINQFFHILKSVEQQRGCVHIEGDKYEITIYSSCCNLNTGVYYYTTYDNPQINAVDMHKEDLDGDTLKTYPLNLDESINWQN